MSLSILIVEDCEPIRTFVKTFLQSQVEACRCLEAGSGEEAMDVIRAYRPDLVVMDFDMPGINGIEAARLIRAESPGTPIAMFTSVDDANLRAEARDAGIADFIQKSDYARLATWASEFVSAGRAAGPRLEILFALALGALLIAAPVQAASDDASSATYDAGWTNASTGGTGFGPWQLAVGGNGGHFTASSTGNAGGSSGNIDTGGRSWGMWSTNGTTEAVRTFDTALTTGQEFRVSFDNGYIDSGKSAGVALRNNSGQNLWEFYFAGGSNRYVIHHQAGNLTTDIPFTGDGVELIFNLVGPTSYFCQVLAHIQGGTNKQFYIYAGDLISQSDAAIRQFRAWNFEAGPGSDYDVFVNGLLVGASSLINGSVEPRTTSWFTNYSARYARVYTTDADLTASNAVTTWTRNTTTQSSPAYSGIQQVFSSTNWVYLRSTGLGSHRMGPWYLNVAHSTLFPNLPVNSKALYRLPRRPLAPVSRTATGLGTIGYFVDGVAMFDSTDGYHWNTTSEVNNGTGYWNREAYVNEGVTFDPGNAHQEQTGTYHYHANPPALRFELGDHVTYNAASQTYAESTNPVTTHSPVLGWVRDGNPIYGPYGYSNPTNPASGVRRMVSGYALRNGANGTDNLSVRTNIPAWAVRVYSVSATQTGPTVSVTYPLGRYMEDNAYLGDLGYTQGIHFDLDEYNGRFCVTPEFPNGTYAYFVSLTATGTPAFPYNIGRRFYGDPAGSSVPAITEPVDTNFLGGAEIQESIKSMSNGAATVTLVWSSVEGGGYVVDSATNLTTWNAIATNVAASTNGITTTFAATNTADFQRFLRIKRVTLAAYDSAVGSAGVGILSISPNSGARGNSVPFTITFDNTAPPQMAPVLSLTIGTNVISGASHTAQTTVTGTFNIGAGAATGAKDVYLIWPGPPGNPTAYVTNYLLGGFTIQ